MALPDVIDVMNEGLPLAPPAPPPLAAKRLPWRRRGVDALSTYLPLALMTALALGTWWLLKNNPLDEAGRAVAPLRHEPDYAMNAFTVQRFAADGSIRTQIEGDVLRHYPDTDTFEIDGPRIRSIAPDGRVTTANARHALSNADGSEFELAGGAHLVREATASSEAIAFDGEFLHAFLRTERVVSHLPVTVRQGKTEVEAAGMAYDNLARIVDLNGRMRAVFAPPPRPVR